MLRTDEAFFINLTNSQNVTFARSTAVVTIISDDSASGNPIDLDGFMVRQHYLDFLGRNPDADGLNFWVASIKSCGADAGCLEVHRINASAAFFLSIEFQGTGYLSSALQNCVPADATGTSTFQSTHQLPVPMVRQASSSRTHFKSETVLWFYSLAGKRCSRTTNRIRE